jgi:hypothetical protein
MLNKTPPVLDITYNGNPLLTPFEITGIQANRIDTAFTGLSATATSLMDGSITPISEGTISKGVLGRQTIKYTATDLAGNETSITVGVTVADTERPRIIVHNGASTHATDFSITREVNRGGTFTPLLFIVTDNFDAVVPTRNVVCDVNLNRIGTYTCTYTATDSSGNHAIPLVVTVNVVYSGSPVIEVGVSNDVPLGSSFNPRAGVTASDDYDDDLTADIEITFNDVNVDRVGSYTVSYRVVNSEGRPTTLDRTINVRAVTAATMMTPRSTCYANGDCYSLYGANNNYVWFSGYLWRAYKVNDHSSSTPTIKLVSEDAIAAMSFNETNEVGSTFPGSFAEQWLTNNFLPTIGNDSLIATGIYCNQRHAMTHAEYVVTREIALNRTCDPAAQVPTRVGLLTIEEYAIVGGATSYLNTGDWFYTMTPSNSTGRNVWTVNDEGRVFTTHQVANTFGIRPVITLKSDVTFREGTGSFDKPFRITGDNSATNGNLHLRNSGEYVNFAGHTWRIIEGSSGAGTRLIMSDYFRMPGTQTYAQLQYGNSNKDNFTSASGVGNFLNNTVLNAIGLPNSAERNALVDTALYASPFAKGWNVRTHTLNNNINHRFTALVGLPTVGEVLSSRTSQATMRQITTWNGQYNNVATWMINHTEDGQVWQSNLGATDIWTRERVTGVRPVITLRPTNVTITGGQGTPTKPYEISY